MEHLYRIILLALLKTAFSTTPTPIPNPVPSVPTLLSLSSRLDSLRSTPDIFLTIRHSTLPDATTAASLLSLVGRRSHSFGKPDSPDPPSSTASAIVNDRRYEMLVEAVVCQLKKKKDWEKGVVSAVIDRTRTPPKSRTDPKIVDSIDFDQMPPSPPDRFLPLSAVVQTAWGVTALFSGIDTTDTSTIPSPNSTSTNSTQMTNSKLAGLSYVKLFTKLRDHAMCLVHNSDSVSPSSSQSVIKPTEIASCLHSFGCVYATWGVQSVDLVEQCKRILLLPCENATDYLLLDELRPSELINVVWAAAVHGQGQEEERVDSVGRKFVEEVTRRILEIVDKEVVEIVDVAENVNNSIEVDEVGADVANNETLSDGSVVADAASIIANENEIGTEISPSPIPSPTLIPSPVQNYTFTPKDLSATLWALTTMSVPSPHLLHLTMLQIDSLPIDNAFGSMSGADLTNLAWSIARRRFKQMRNHVEKKGGEREDRILRNIGDAALKMMQMGEMHFHPADLSQLLWSLAILNSEPNASLAAKAVEVSASQISASTTCYTPDDLARIVWAYQKITSNNSNVSNNNKCSSSTLTITSLGKLYASIESRHHSMNPTLLSLACHSFASLCKSFPLLRSGKDLVLLAATKLTTNANISSTATTTTKSIAIKPTIMVLSSLAQTTSSGSTTGVSSSSAECSLVGRRLASLVVSLLNSEQQQRILLDETGRERRVALTDVLTPTEICEVFFSGGTFGVRVDRKVEKGGFEPGISIKEFEFGKLKIHDVSNFGWGMLMMGYLNCRGERERALVVRMVEELGRKMGEGGEVMESQDLRRCVWVLTSIRSHLNSSIREKELEKEMEKEKVEKMDKIAKDVENDISISGNSTNHDSDNNNNNNNNNNDNNSGSDNDHNHNLLRATDKQLQKLANIVEVEAEKDTLSCADLRFVLQSFVASTTRADEMVKAIEKCASRRLEIFGLGGGQKQKQKQIVGGLIEEVATLSVKSVESLGGERALLYSELKEGKEDFAKKEQKTKVIECFDRSLTIMNEAATKAKAVCNEAERVQRGSGGLDLDQILKDIEEAAAFQLGRCIMLVETYREMSWEEDGSMKRVFRKINKRLSRLF